MVFASLDEYEKEAFFSLLDEYFKSRPHLLTGQEQGGVGITPAQANAVAGAGAAAFGKAMAANPRATTAVVNAGLQRAGVPKGIQLPPTAPAAVNTPSHDADDDDAAGNSALTSVADRIKRLGGAGLKPPAPLPSPKPTISAPKPNSLQSPPAAPPRLPGRSSAAHTPEIEQEYEQEEEEEEQAAPAPPQRAPFNPRTSTPQGLVSRKSIGSLDTTSKGAFVGSAFSKKKQPTALTPPVPAAFAAKPNDFAPPPIRRVPSDAGSIGSTASGAATRKTPPVPRQPIPEPEEVEQEEEAGEWAEVLYDYKSGEPTDLVIREGQNLLVIEKASEDWWKGQLNGKEGLFPSSYVRIL
ncbi:hypothetical protein BKA62DRAFT_766670 [Auriculariales sp. MPI-PUGE-AT-0066]|nr:hypothetical protein BKA62DRAFT_766670 [Auriculariales sp. MPI-PUGE-AT-0066]